MTALKKNQDIIFLQRKLKSAKCFQQQFDKHIERLERLLTIAKKFSASGRPGPRRAS